MLHITPLSILALLLLTTSVWAAPHCTTSSASPTVSMTEGTSTAISPAPSPSGSVSNNTGRIAMAWYAGWTTNRLPFSDVSWSKYDALAWAFAVTTSDVKVVELPDSPDQVDTFVTEAHNHSVKALVSVGGWTGSQYFSPAVATADNRTAFVKTMTSLIDKHDFDGLDFDWEYPGKQGIGCNIVSPNDSDNFLLFLQELRQAPEMQNKTISAAVSIEPFMGKNNQPMDNVSAFADVFDHIEIMAYDIWGAFPGYTLIGPNAPLNDTCDPLSTHQKGSAVSAVKAWSQAGFPANKIVLGVPAYGRSYSLDRNTAFDVSSSSNASSNSSIETAQDTREVTAYPKFTDLTIPQGDSLDVASTQTQDQCGNPVSVYTGLWNFGGLIESGMLYQNGTPVSGVGFRYDACSQTPYLYSDERQSMISYDDAFSLAAKGKFVAENSLKGFALWEASGDYNDILLDSISSAMNS